MKQLTNWSMASIAALSLYTVTPGLAQDEPFIYRAPLDPYKIQQLPDFQMHSRQRSDFIIQRAVFPPGVGGWHTHPGPSFAYVVQGHIKLQKYTDKDGCFETPVYGPGDIYIKPANELHRAVILGDEDEVELIVRFNYSEGSNIGIPAQDPGCPPPDTTWVSRSVDLKVGPAADTLENLILQEVVPFTFRATLDPYKIHQLPDFLMHSKVARDVVIQRSLFPPGTGGWHMHPGPSFVYVVSGRIKIEELDKKGRIVETAVRGPDEAYFEEGNRIHRAVVLSEEGALLLVARFNIPVGADFSIPVTVPGH